MGLHSKDKRASRWLVLVCIAFLMFSSYFFDDIFSTISHLFNQPDLLELGWDASDYGEYRSAYSLFCIFGGLVICGMLLDRWGIRLTGSVFVLTMAAGAALVTYAISERFAGSAFEHFLSGFFDKPSVALAYAGCAFFGLGSEIAGVTVNRSIARWFKGKEIALAMGLHLALARFGTAIALLLIPRIVDTGGFVPFSETSKPALIGLSLIVLGVILWTVFLWLDYRLSQREKEEEDFEKAGDFKFSDITDILVNRHFIYTALLCVFFYVCVVSFRKFGTAILIPRFGVDENIASTMISLIPFSTIVFAPLFGFVVDKKGRGTRLMILGSSLVLLSHLIFAFAPQYRIFAYIGVCTLGIGYSMVPAAMWPSVPKIIPEKSLGTAFSLLYWIQNIGLFTAPLVIGTLMHREIDQQFAEETAYRAAFYAELLFVALAVISLLVALSYARSSDRHPELKLDERCN